jgi:hypothetical protein
METSAIEQWKEIDGFAGRYRVSNMGRIFCVVTGVIRAQTPTRDGYRILRFKLPEGGSKPIEVHRFVAAAFCPNPNALPVVNHINHDKADNRAVNLEWVTPKGNAAHAAIAGRVGWRLLSKEQEDEIRRVLAVAPNKTKVTLELAAIFGVSKNTIFRAANPHRREYTKRRGPVRYHRPKMARKHTTNPNGVRYGASSGPHQPDMDTSESPSLL